MLIRREKEPSRRVWFSFIFIGFLFWLRADGGLALFLLLLFFVFIARGDHLSEMSNRVGGVACLVVVFLDHASQSGFVCLFVFVSCCVCLFTSSSHYIYIYGGISFWTHAWHLLWLKSCRLSVCLFLFLIVNVICLRSISRIVSACASL